MRALDDSSRIWILESERLLQSQGVAAVVAAPTEAEAKFN